VLPTPHIAGLAPDYEERVLALFKENVARYLEGRPLINVVDRQLGY
jgi:phosphoglycerate dehydrogenase-like enzyme